MQTQRQKAVIYCRVSSKEQEDSGYSLPAQEKFLRDYADQKGFDIVEVFSVAESASGAKIRGVFLEMIRLLEKKNIHILICEKTDRLTRSRRDSVTVDEWVKKNHDNETHFVKENFVLSRESRANEKFIWSIKVGVAEYYTDNLSEEVKKGQKEKADQGWLPTKPPLGYMSIGEHGRRTHVPNEKVAPLMRRMFEYYASGQYSIKKLNKRMYEEGLRTGGGFRLVTSRMHTLLQDPFYCGDFLWKDVRYPGKHEPLISKDLFEQCQKIRDGRNIPHLTKHDFTFKKVLRCGECDGTITAELKKSRYIYYHCNHYRKCSQKEYTHEEKIEEQLFGVFKFFESITPEEADRIRAKIKENHATDIAYKETTLNALHEQYMRLQKRLDKLYDDHLDERIDDTRWKAKDAEIREQQAAIQKQITKLKSQEAKYFELWIDIIGLSFRMREIYERHKNPEDRRKLLAHIFTDLVLTDEGLTYKLKETIQKIADRVRQRIDGEKTLELPANAPKTLYPPIISTAKSSKKLETSPEAEKVFRTQENPTITTLSGALTPQTNILLPG